MLGSLPHSRHPSGHTPCSARCRTAAVRAATRYTLLHERTEPAPRPQHAGCRRLGKTTHPGGAMRLKIERMTYGPDAVAHADDGKTVFV